MGTIEYSSNNSGGSWWLTDENWKALEAAGWKVDWVADRDPDKPSILAPDSDGRWLGALAMRATKETDDPEAAISEWEQITGEDSTAEGCNCCGNPHDFTFDDGEGNRRYSTVTVTSTARSWS